MLLPAAVRPYAIETSCKNSRVRCAIALRGSQALPISLCGRLKCRLFGRNQLLPLDDVLIIALHLPNGDVPLFDSRCDGYANALDDKQPPAPLPLHSAVCPKCRNTAFQVDLSFEYPDAEEASAFANPGDAFTWVWIVLRCTRCRAVFRGDLECD